MNHKIKLFRQTCSDNGFRPPDAAAQDGMRCEF